MRRSFWQAFWRLARPYWVSEDRWAGRALFGTLVALALALVWVEVRLNTWNGQFYNALQEKQYDDFKRLLLEFCGWAFLFIVLAVYQLYFNQMLQMRWRRWLTDVYLVRWLEDATHYRLSLADFGTDNPDQRISEDFRSFVSTTLSLFFGLLSSVVTFISFVSILWVLSGAIEIAGVNIPGYMVWVALVYALVGSLGAHLIGRPLIALNFLQERYEADFRFALVRARENAEGIALYRGEADELKGFRERFTNVVNNWWSIMKVQKRFTWFATFYGQLAIIFPMVVAAPRYFSGAIQLGGLTQISGAFGQVQKSLSWFVDAYVQIANLRASIQRLDQFATAIEVARGLGHGAGGAPAIEQGSADGVSGAPAAIDLGEVRIGVPERADVHGGDAVAEATPDTATASTQPALAAPVVRELILTDHQRIEPGAHTLISGPSGSGKSTLFRLLSGIWPFAQGRFVPSARDDSLFLPQKPYLPLGTLRDAVAYPRQQAQFSDEQIRQALQRAMLPALTGELDRSANWSQTLSGGEQQRLAIARALLIRPRWLFLDEATSALDEKTEAAIYGILREDLPDTTLVSIAHRAAVAQYHHQRLLVQPQADGVATLSLQPIQQGSSDA